LSLRMRNYRREIVDRKIPEKVMYHTLA